MSKYSGPMHVPNKRAKKPQGAPKRAISSFLSFSQLMRPEIRLQYPNLKNTDLSSVLAQKWHEASDEAKRPHIERELRDREKYHEDMGHWKDCELERIELEKSGLAAALAENGKTASPTQLSYLNQHPSSSLWAAMIDVNEASSFDNGPNGPPLYDEAMVGFWDTEMEGCDNQFGSSTGSEKSSEKGEKITIPTNGRFISASSKSSLFHPGITEKRIGREIPLTTAKKSKEERLAKRAKGQRLRPSPSGLGTPGGVQFPCAANTDSSVDLSLTAQQLEIQQRRLQQQHQYQMYQQHLLKQKTKQEIQDYQQYNNNNNNSNNNHNNSNVNNNNNNNTSNHNLRHGHIQGQGQGLGHGRMTEGDDIRSSVNSKLLLSAGSIVESGRLHMQSLVNQRNENDDSVQYQSQKQSSYQGTGSGTGTGIGIGIDIQRNHLASSSMLPWPLGLLGYVGGGSMDQQSGIVQNTNINGVRRGGSTYSRPMAPYCVDPYYNTLPYPASGHGYGLMDGIERYFFDAPTSTSTQSQSISQSASVPESSTYQGQNRSHNEVSALPISINQNNSNSLNSTLIKNGNDNSILSNSDASMRSLQFDEQDRFCVMQTLMAVHRATANKAGDCETIRSLDRMQMAQQGQESRGQGQGQEGWGQGQEGRGQGQEGWGWRQGQEGWGQGHGVRGHGSRGQGQEGWGQGQESQEQRHGQGGQGQSSGCGVGNYTNSKQTLNTTTGGNESSSNQYSSNSTIISATKNDKKFSKSRSSECMPLSLQQQERQNQTERQQLKDRQMRQMQEMLLLQEREQAMQKQEHSTSMVTAGVDRSTTSFSPLSSTPTKFSNSDDPTYSCDEDSEEGSNPDDSANSCPESDL